MSMYELIIKRSIGLFSTCDNCLSVAICLDNFQSALAVLLNVFDLIFKKQSKIIE